MCTVTGRFCGLCASCVSALTPSRRKTPTPVEPTGPTQRVVKPLCPPTYSNIERPSAVCATPPLTDCTPPNWRGFLIRPAVRKPTKEVQHLRSSFHSADPCQTLDPPPSAQSGSACQILTAACPPPQPAALRVAASSRSHCERTRRRPHPTPGEVGSRGLTPCSG